MRLIIEEVEGSIYIDAILKEDESIKLKEGELLEAMAIIKSRRYYIGVRVGEPWRHSDSQEFLIDKSSEKPSHAS